MKKSNITLWALALLGCLCGTQAFAQTNVNMPFNTGQATFTINPAGSFYNFFDNGGAAVAYSNGLNVQTSVREGRLRLNDGATALSDMIPQPVLMQLEADATDLLTL